MRILYITDYIPYPPVTGDLIRNYSLIRRVSKYHQVSVVCFISNGEPSEHLLAIQEFCERLETVPLPQRSKVSRVPGVLRYLVAGIPFEFEFLNSEILREKIKCIVNDFDFDIIQFEQSRMAPYLSVLHADDKSKRILTFHNVAANQYKRISNIAQSPLGRVRTWVYSQMLYWWEPRYAQRFDRCITVSESDRNELLKANPRLKIDVISNGIDTKSHRLLDLDLSNAKPALLFVGSLGYAPNADGVVWFCNKILPLLRDEIHDIQVWIVGISPPPEVTGLESENVHVTGRVDNVVPYYERCAISIVPLRAGGGTRLKILESMALGRPVVSTAIGCEGLDVVDGRHLLVGDSPRQFAHNIIRLLKDPILFNQIAEGARKLVVERYDWDVIAEELLNVYSSLGQENEYRK